MHHMSAEIDQHPTTTRYVVCTHLELIVIPLCLLVLVFALRCLQLLLQIVGRILQLGILFLQFVHVVVVLRVQLLLLRLVFDGHLFRSSTRMDFGTKKPTAKARHDYFANARPASYHRSDGSERDESLSCM